MSRRWRTVQKRLSELESELIDAFQFRLLPHSDNTQKISRRLQKRFGYISNLLSAEAASTPEKTYQLREMGEKLAELEAVFRWWNGCPSDYAFNNYIQDNDSDSDGLDSPQVAAEHFAGGEEEYSGRSWGRFCKLCGAFGGGVIAGAVSCMSIINFSSFYIWEYQDIIYDIHPT